MSRLVRFWEPPLIGKIRRAIAQAPGHQADVFFGYYQQEPLQKIAKFTALMPRFQQYLKQLQVKGYGYCFTLARDRAVWLRIRW